MNLHEAIEVMKKSDNFSELLEIMIHRAEKGLIEGITVDDIRAELNGTIPVQETINEDFSYEELIPLIYELQEAVNEFGQDKETETLTENYITELDLNSNEEKLNMNETIENILK